MKRLAAHRTVLAAYLALLAASVVWISWYGGPLPFLSFYLLLLFPLSSVIYLAVVSQTIRFYQDMPSHRMVKGAQAAYCLRVENAGILPFVRVTLRLESELAELRGLQENEDVALMPGERRELRSELTCRYAGTYEVGLLSYRVEDCFHFLRLELPAPEPFRAIVLPRITDDAGRTLNLETLNHVLEMRNQLLTEPTPGSDLREYRRGDSLRRIHWKNSARAQKLLTRLPEPKEMQQLQIVMLPAKESGDLPDVQRRDRFLELAVSLASYYCGQNRPVAFHYPGDHVQTKIVDSYVGFREFYENLPDTIRYRETMDEAAWDAWIRENCLAGGGTVLLLREDAPPDAYLTVYRGM